MSVLSINELDIYLKRFWWQKCGSMKSFAPIKCWTMLKNGLQCNESWKKSRNNFKIKIVFQHISNTQQCQPTLNQSKQLDKYRVIPICETIILTQVLYTLFFCLPLKEIQSVIFSFPIWFLFGFKSVIITFEAF